MMEELEPWKGWYPMTGFAVAAASHAGAAMEST